MNKLILSFSKFLKLNESDYDMPNRTEKNWGANELIIAVENNNVEEVVEILTSEKGKDKNYINAIEDYNGMSALHIAVEQGNLKMVKLLLQFGVDPNTLDSTGSTPLDNMRYVNYRRHFYDPELIEEIKSTIIKAGGECIGLGDPLI